MSFTLQNIAPEIEHKTTKDFDSIPKYLDMDSIIDYAIPLSYHTFASSIIQDIYETYEPYREKIFQNISPHILYLSFANIGNYVIQKIIECDPNKSKIILDQIKNYIFQLSMDKHGTYVIQKLIENIPEECLGNISKELEGHYLELAMDKDGNQVLQKLIKRQKKEENDKIFIEISNYLILLLRNQYGCYVVQGLLDNCSEITYNQIFEISGKNIKTLINNKYGNYIIKYFLENAKGDMSRYIDIICQAIKGNIFNLSRKKNSVMIIERVLEMGNKSQRKNIIKEIINLDQVQKDCLTTLAKDDYGNHVVKLLLKFSDEETREIMARKILSDPGVQKNEGKSASVVYYIENILKKVKIFDNFKK